MSDGPWKSLPLRPHWKRVARQAENGAFSLEDLSRALATAVRKEAEKLPLGAVRRAVLSSDQGVLFEADLLREFEGLRREHPGSKIVQTFFACLRDHAADGPVRREMVESAVADTLYECIGDHSRAIVEHYYRKRPSSTVPVDRRLSDACRLSDFQALASQIAAPCDASSSSPPEKQSGLDDGPPL